MSLFIEDTVHKIESILGDFHDFGITHYEFLFLKRNIEIAEAFSDEMKRDVRRVVKSYEYHVDGHERKRI
jgi:hypothetical protein